MNSGEEETTVAVNAGAIARRKASGKFHSFYINYCKHKGVYWFLVPGIIFFIIFHYVPMYGIIIAFKDFNMRDGILGSEWVGFKYFRILFNSSGFYSIFSNTIVLNLYALAVNFPGPIILALMLNEVRNIYYKKTVQTIVYFPHFLSWVIVGGIVFQFFQLDGYLNRFIENVFHWDQIPFLTSEKYFRTIYVCSGLWKEAGWGTIIFLSSITSIDKTLYEAAIADGAGRFRQMWHITLPGIAPTMVVVLILRLGRMMDANFEHVYVLYNPLVYDVSDVFSTYIYRVGLQDARYSYTTAIGLFQSAIGFSLIMSANYLSRKTSDLSLW